MKRFVVLTATVLLSAAFASAGPIMPKHIGKDAKWFGHVDFEALRAMKLVQDMKDECPMHKQCQEKMQELAQKLGMNPMEDVLGVTLYADRYGGHVGVGLVYVKEFDRERMLALLKEKHPHHTTSEYGGRTLYTWAAGRHDKKMDITGVFASGTLIVMGADAGQVKAALDVLDGKAPCLDKDAPLLRGIAEDALFASRGLDVPEEYRKTTRCPVLHTCRAASVVWTAKEGAITGTYEFATVSEETAKNFKTIVDGLKAMADLRFGDVPTMKKLLDGLKCETKGDSFTATFTTSTDDVESAVKAMMEKMKSRHQK